MARLKHVYEADNLASALQQLGGSQSWESALTLPCRGASTTLRARKTAAQASICAGAHQLVKS
jgi:hypothetical protein